MQQEEHTNADQEETVELGQIERQALLTTNEDRALLYPKGLGRVKSIDFHKTRGWLLVTAHFSGDIVVWDCSEDKKHRVVLQRVHLSDLPLRSAKFVERMDWIVAASDDTKIFVVSLKTGETIQSWKAHQDYIRGLEVHPSLPYLISCADDTEIKVWDWEYGFSLSKVFKGHLHYVMQVRINPKDTSSFASASLDGTIRLWKLNDADQANLGPENVLRGHEEGVNCLEYDPSPDRYYIISGSDDRTIRIWNYKVGMLLHCLVDPLRINSPG